MGEQIRVLVVDDEHTILKSIRGLVEDKGHHVAVASNGEEALRKIEDEGYDIVITDYYMPVMNGKELLVKIRADYPKTLVIVVSGFFTVEDRLDFIFKGAFSCIKKPFNASEINSIINTAVKLCYNQSQLTN